MIRTCSLCGTIVEVDEDDVPAGWSFGVDERGVTWQCATCVRAHVRSIEAKLPEEYW